MQIVEIYHPGGFYERMGNVIVAAFPAAFTPPTTLYPICRLITSKVTDSYE